MLSICIPVFNINATRLVEDLHGQVLELGVPAELVLLDDASDLAFKEQNRQLASLPHVRYEELKHNVGRSKIRNMLSAKARYPLLLFMDCDMEVNHPGFLKRYLEAGRDGSVVCGGHTYQKEKPPHPYLLHWLNGTDREVKPASYRQKRPHHSFMTSCVLIPAEAMYVLPFNEELKGYGHEDTLYGYQLMKNGTSIKHIDNPAIHTGLETAGVFLEKTLQGLKNLCRIYLLTNQDEDFARMSRMLNTYLRLKHRLLYLPYSHIFSVTEKLLIKNLTGKNPDLRAFDMYKLGILGREMAALATPTTSATGTQAT